MKAVEVFGSYIQSETLADSLSVAANDGKETDINDSKVVVAVVKA